LGEAIDFSGLEPCSRQAGRCSRPFMHQGELQVRGFHLIDGAKADATPVLGRIQGPGASEKKPEEVDSVCGKSPRKRGIPYSADFVRNDGVGYFQTVVERRPAVALTSQAFVPQYLAQP
jgi:hypothetical protein